MRARTNPSGRALNSSQRNSAVSNCWRRNLKLCKSLRTSCFFVSCVLCYAVLAKLLKMPTAAGKFNGCPPVEKSTNGPNWNIYRLSDAIGHLPNITGCESYPTSLACDYERETQQPNDLAALTRILKLKKWRRARPRKRVAIFHARLGDGLCAQIDPQCRGNRTDIPDCWNSDADCFQNPASKRKQYALSKLWYVSVMEEIRRLDFDIQTATVIANKRYWSRSTDPRNCDYTVDDAYLKKMSSFLRKYFKRVELREEGRADEDFVFMSSANVFVPSGGGYSALIAQVVIANNGTVVRPKLLSRA